MDKINKNIELGDLFELETDKGNRIYFQCVQMPTDVRNEVELVKVFYNLYSKTPSDLCSVVEGDFFFNRFPLKTATRKKIIRKIGNCPLPDNFEAPLYYRTENPFGEGWQIINAENLKRETIQELSEKQKKLSPWGSMNDTMIIELLEKGWNLENWTLHNRFPE